MSLEILPLFQTLLVVSFKAGLLILAILIVRSLIGKQLPPAWRHAIWGLVPLQLLLCVSIPSSWSIYNLLPQEAEQTAILFFETAESDQPTVIIEPNTVPETTETIETTQVNEIVPPAETETAETIPPVVILPSTPQFKPSWPHFLLGGWLLGCVVMAVVFLRQMLLCRHWLRQADMVESESVLHLFKKCAKRMKVRTWLVIAESRSVSGPLLIGAIRPSLLLPHGLVKSATKEQLQTIFLHELAHLKRWDVWIGWGMTALLTVHWFNPLLWLAVRKMNADREEACDAMALQSLDPREHPSYGHALIDIAQNFVTPARTPGLVGISETGKHLLRRLEMIKLSGTWKLRWKVLAIFAVLFIGLATMTDAQDRPQQRSAAEIQAQIDRLQAELARTKEAEARGEAAPAPAQRVARNLPGSYFGTEGDDKFGIVIGNPNDAGVFPIMMYEDGLPEKGYDPNDDDRYEGTAKLVEGKLQISLAKKFDGKVQERVEAALRELTAAIEMKNVNDVRTLEITIPKNAEWDGINVKKELRIRPAVNRPAVNRPAVNRPAVDRSAVDRSAIEIARNSTARTTHFPGSYLGTEGDDKFGIVIGNPNNAGVFPITMYEDGLPEKGYDPNDDDRYEGTARLLEGKLQISLTKKYDGKKEERVEEALRNLSANYATKDVNGISKLVITIPKNAEWDAIEVSRELPIRQNTQAAAEARPRVRPAANLPGSYLGTEGDDKFGIVIGNPNDAGVFPITMYEDGLPGQGHDPSDDDRYEGTAKMAERKLQITFEKKFDGRTEERVENAIKNLTASIEGATLSIPKNAEWDAVKVSKTK